MPDQPQSLRPRDPEAVRRVQEIIDRIIGQWKDDHVADLMPVVKVVRGVAQPEQLAIGFFVHHKLTAAQVEERGLKPIPSAIEGVPTDVLPVHAHPYGTVDERHTRSQMFDTLIGGIAVGNAKIGAYGTLAMICFAQSDSRPLGLTNEHVLVFNTDGHAGDEVEQPRFYLHREASIDPAPCCPNGQIRFREPENVIADIAAGVFVAAALAAALSDEIDPHRRGQDATPVDPGERTHREVVSAEIDYRQIPFPGQPYKLGVKWKYSRTTDRRVLTASADEERTNPHVIAEQALLTDAERYPRGALVRFLAMLGPELEAKSCNNYFVTAACQSPSGQRKYRVVLRLLSRHQKEPSGGEWQLAHGERQNLARQCFSFLGAARKVAYRKPIVINGLVIDPAGNEVIFVQSGPDGPPVMRIPGAGVVIRMPRSSARITAHVQLHAQQPVTMIAFSGSTEVARAATKRGDVASVLSVSGARISHVRMEGGSNEATLSQLCLEREPGAHCLYAGELRLAPDEELGIWQTYVFAQIRNNVPLGTDPLMAAQTIGGLAVTNNFVAAGDSYNITYGHSCLIDVVPDGQFEVVAGTPQSVQ
jgi:hypothetical protein